MYFEEELKLESIQKKLNGSEESIKAVILDARQKALKILVEMHLGSLTDKSIEGIRVFIKNKKNKFKQTGLPELALECLLNNILRLVLEERHDKDKMGASGTSDKFQEFRFKKLEDLLSDESGPNKLTREELQNLKKQILEVRQAPLELLSVHFVCGFSHYHFLISCSPEFYFLPLFR